MSKKDKKKATAKDIALNKVKGVHFSFFTQFGEFIKEYGVVGLAIGVVIGSAVTKYVNAIVENLISPLIGLVLSLVQTNSKNLSEITWGPVEIGAFLSSTIEFVIVLAIIFFAVKYVLKFFKLVEDKKEQELKK